jgi:Flp pilus assembly protein TadG
MTRTIATRSWPARRLLSRVRRLGEDGVSAVEFALIAPILFLSLLAMVDVGFAIHERMTIDHVLRAGAQEHRRR